MDWNDKEAVLAAVKEDGWALGHASVALQNDKEVVLTAVQNDGYALEYASNALRNDKEVVLAAVQNDTDGEALRFASEALQVDPEMVSWTNLSRAQCFWRKYRERYRTERIVEYWGQQTMRATFDANGKPIMKGRGAKRAREEYEASFE